ncbi:hypothetical protein ElyMa_004266500 [Elysia marginata]|uniref:Uncharacterized protein n=1 Tax=Elysia marginata TaxID=1093978 RepID=A0AAV4GU69_9GAST|nr:hypothetical protein ElyMa_004266500 [Elysia marginata]
MKLKMYVKYIGLHIQAYRVSFQEAVAFLQMRTKMIMAIHFPPACASPSLPFTSPVFRRLVPRPASPSPLLLASSSGLAQPSLPFVTSVVLRYSVPLPPTPTHMHIVSCVASITGPTLVQPQSSSVRH